MHLIYDRLLVFMSSTTRKITGDLNEIRYYVAKITFTFDKIEMKFCVEIWLFV